jgi:hypothetical protein
VIGSETLNTLEVAKGIKQQQLAKGKLHRENQLLSGESLRQADEESDASDSGIDKFFFGSRVIYYYLIAIKT